MHYHCKECKKSWSYPLENCIFCGNELTVSDLSEYKVIGSTDRCILSAHSRGTLPLLNKYPRNEAPVKVGKDVWMASECIVIQGVDIGDNSVIGTGAVVNKNIPANSLAVGVPAKVIKKLDSEVDL